MLNEYAVRVYSLIADSMRMDASLAIERANIVMLPKMKKDQQQEFLNELRKRAEDPTETLLADDSESDTNKLKGIFGNQ